MALLVLASEAGKSINSHKIIQINAAIQGHSRAIPTIAALTILKNYYIIII